jgi:hypothetical protein
MAGLVPAIHVFLACRDVDARDEPGHDELLHKFNRADFTRHQIKPSLLQQSCQAEDFIDDFHVMAVLAIGRDYICSLLFADPAKMAGSYTPAGQPVFLR